MEAAAISLGEEDHEFSPSFVRRRSEFECAISGFEGDLFLLLLRLFFDRCELFFSVVEEDSL